VIEQEGRFAVKGLVGLPKEVGSSIEHDVIIKDDCHIATAATINSGVRIGTGTSIGSNSSEKCY
jgi:acetyltransferase-like isoleucine patch superfamily enzyme